MLHNTRIVKNVTGQNRYVPQHLLKNFTDAAGNPWIYDSELSKVRYGNTSSAGFECKLYPPAVENALTKHIDTPSAEDIARQLERKQIDQNQRANFPKFVANKPLHAELKRMRWTILGVPNGEPDLIIGDHAVMLSDQGPDDEPPAPLGRQGTGDYS